MRVKFGNSTKDVPILEVTAENYIVPKGEEGTYHCRIEQVNFDQHTGKRLSKPIVQKFEPKMFDTIVRNLKQQGWTIDILHNPTEYLAEQEAKVKELQEMTYKQRKEAAEQAKKAERDALKKEILAELKDAGLLKEPKTKGDKK